MRATPVIFRAIFAVACMLGIGCIPEEEFFWLPDSSGFLYLDHESSSVVHYDVPKKRHRTIVKLQLPNRDTHIGSLAISPDGKRFAVTIGEISVNADTFAEAIRLEVYDLTGTRVHASEVLRRSVKRESPTDVILGRVGTYATWSPDGKRILAAVAAISGTGEFGDQGLPSITGVYELEGGNLHLFRETLGVGIPEFLPDGTGVLYSKDNNINNVSFAVVDWEGWEYELETEPNVNEAVIAELNTADFDTTGVCIGWTLSSRVWQNEVRDIPWADGKIRIDLRERTVRFETDTAQRELRQYAKSQMCKVIAQLRGGVVLQVRPIGPGSGDQEPRLEIAVPTERKTKTVVPHCTWNGKVSVAPDGELAVVRYRKNGSSRMLVVDRGGQVIVDRDSP